MQPLLIVFELQLLYVTIVGLIGVDNIQDLVGFLNTLISQGSTIIPGNRQSIKCRYSNKFGFRVLRLTNITILV